MDLQPLGSAHHQYPWKSYPRSLDCCWEKLYEWWGTLYLSLILWHTENAWIRHLWSVALRRKQNGWLFYVGALWQKRLVPVFTPGGNLIQGAFLWVPPARKIITYFGYWQRGKLAKFALWLSDHPWNLCFTVWFFCEGCYFSPSGS